MGFGGQRKWDELPVLCGVSSGVFRALQVRGGNGTAVTSHLGLLCHPCSCQVLGMLPASPWSIPAAETLRGIEELPFSGALLPSSSPNEA